ncbi:Os03g0639150, partial [Oryza sativa Japonica Group]
SPPRKLPSALALSLALLLDPPPPRLHRRRPPLPSAAAVATPLTASGGGATSSSSSSSRHFGFRLVPPPPATPPLLLRQAPASAGGWFPAGWLVCTPLLIRLRPPPSALRPRPRPLHCCSYSFLSQGWFSRFVSCLSRRSTSRRRRSPFVAAPALTAQLIPRGSTFPGIPNFVPSSSVGDRGLTW